MMAHDIAEINSFIREVEGLLRQHNVPAALVKCDELKRYIQVLSGAVV